MRLGGIRCIFLKLIGKQNWQIPGYNRCFWIVWMTDLITCHYSSPNLFSHLFKLIFCVHPQNLLPQNIHITIPSSSHSSSQTSIYDNQYGRVISHVQIQSTISSFLCILQLFITFMQQQVHNLLPVCHNSVWWRCIVESTRQPSAMFLQLLPFANNLCLMKQTKALQTHIFILS